MNNPADAFRQITDNWHRVVNEVSEAAVAAGRHRESVRIVAVSKYVGATLTDALVAAGCRDLGESRPQSLWTKVAELGAYPEPPSPHPSPPLRGARGSKRCRYAAESLVSGEALGDAGVRWHLVGHLQRNKVRRTVPLVSLVHSIDSVRLAEAIDAEAQAIGGSIRGLLEVNISGDAAKHGFTADALPAAVEAIGRLRHLRIVGLMGMAAYDSNAAAARRDFENLRRLRDQLVQRGTPEGVALGELSMGMSGDFAEAVAAGATIVRIGSRLFEGLATGDQ